MKSPGVEVLSFVGMEASEVVDMLEIIDSGLEPAVSAVFGLLLLRDRVDSSGLKAASLLFFDMEKTRLLGRDLDLDLRPSFS